MRKLAKKLISCIITAAMIVGGLTLSPITTVEVQAAATTKNVNLRLDDYSVAGISGVNVNTANAATVHYGKYPDTEGVEEALKGTPMPWRVIGYNGTGVASTSNSENATLLAADRVINKVQFSVSDLSNQYSGSTLKDKIEIIAGGLTTIEKEAVSPRTLAVCGLNQEDHGSGHVGNDGYCDGITGSEVTNAVMWPLSTWETQNLNSSLRTITTSALRTFWWLRSPGFESDVVASADSDGHGGSPVDTGANEYYHGSARPAFNLNLSYVLFTSESGVSKSDTFTATSDGSGISSWKLTLRGSDSIDPMKTSGNTNLQTGYTVETLTITHGAADNLTGATQVSAMLTDSNGTVLYYGKINDDIDETSSNVTIPEGLPAGSYSLYVFAETVNGATETDYASALGDQITITVTGPPAVTYHTITTVASPTNGGTASGGGQVADGGSTTLIANPNSGYNFAKWTLSGNQVSTSSSYPISNITADATYTAVFEKKSDFSQNESSGEEQLSSDNTKDAYVNPLVWNYMADNSNSLCLIEKQGPACVTAFKAATPASYAEAFSFNLLLKDSGLFKPTFVKKTGKFVLNIPKEWQKRGRTFALIGIDKNGKTRIFTDKDFSDETITTTLDIEGYAFSLIYTDLVGTEQKANKPSVGTSGVYTVQEGDTLSEVAQKLGKTRKYLKEANNLKNPDKLSVGQKLHY